MKVKITKIGLSENPLFPTPLSESFKPGQENPGVSLPVDYWVIGLIEKKPEIGKSLYVNRFVRNGVEALGVMATSVIQKITEDGFETLNSKYKIEYLED